MFYSFSINASDYGTTGLIDIPTARLKADGVFSTTAAIQSSVNAYAVSYQIFPWLEGTFRYSGTADAASTSSTGFRYYDRNYEAKLLVWRENGWLPQVAVGIRDLVGTGKFGSEYLVANKMIDQWDVAVGMGWGRLAGRGQLSNPLTLLSDNFETRTKDVGRGGNFSVKEYFSGEKVGLFGGVAYQFENYPFRLMAEYNPDEYLWEKSAGGFSPKNPLSFGLQWQAIPDVDITLSHQHGSEWGINIQAYIDTKSKPPKYQSKPFVSSAKMSDETLPKGINSNKWYDLLLYDVERSGLLLSQASISKSASRVSLNIRNRHYIYWPDALQKAQELAQIHVPDDIRNIDFIIEEEGHSVQTIRMNRHSPKSLASFNAQGLILPGRIDKTPRYKTNYIKDYIPFNIELDNRLMLFDPDNPLGYQIYASVGSSIELPKSIKLKGSFRVDLVNNIDKFKRSSSSVLPHVRSDAIEYLREGQTGLESLYLDKRGSFTGELHYRAYAGVLETMYSGLGGEVLYQPFQSRIAFALSGNWVKQRGFEADLKHLKYETYTAFASTYWATPYYNYDVALHIGKYLAKDYGATLEVRRTFNNGWMVGLWATKTNVSAEDFGEGSLDKGMFFRIPLGILGSSGRSAYTTRIRPIQRDGGARIEDFSGDLWWDLRQARYDVFNEEVVQ